VKDLDRAFLEFHEDNPAVYDGLVSLAREAKQRGRTRVGIKMLWEVLRWHTFIQTTGEDFKLSNSLHSRYARLIMATNPDLEGMFELRALRPGQA
jgi:hypothetical protein